MKKYSTVLLALLIISFLIPSTTWSQENDVKSKFPKMLGANNVGKDFWFTIPPIFEEESPGNGYTKIFVTSYARTLVTVEVEGKSYSQQQYTIPNDVIEFNIPPAIGQPYLKQASDPSVPETVFQDYGIHVSADDLIVVYVVCRYYATSDGFLAIPVSSLGNEYICASYPDMTAMYPVYNLPSLCGIVAAFDSTYVTFQLGGNDQTETAGGMQPGDIVDTMLNKGDVWMFSSNGINADLSGSKINADKPIAVVSGNQCANIPLSNRWCDYIVEMDIPTYTWGTAYHVPMVPNRRYPSIIRVFAKESNTTIYRDGLQIGFLTEAGGTINNAYIELRMVSMDDDPRSVVISGDKPIAVTLYNCGVEEDGVSSLYSDPFIMSMTPLEQYQNEITFCTPGVNGTGFPQNYLNLVFQTDENGLIPNDLEYAQVEDGEFVWVRVNEEFGADFEVFDYNINNIQFGVKILELPSEGVFKIRCNTTFAAYSFGYSYCDSYGYPTGATYANLDAKTDTLSPQPNFIVHNDGSVDGAAVYDKPDNPALRSNLSLIVMSSEDSYNYKFEYKDFIPGNDNETSWKLNVIDQSQDARAVLTFTDRCGNDTTITVDYKGISGVNDNEMADFYLKDIVPNPVNKSSLNVEFSLPEDCKTQISIINSLGQVVLSPINEFMEAGKYTKNIALETIISGSYTLLLTAGNQKIEKKFVLIK